MSAAAWNVQLCTKYKQILINEKLHIGKKSKEIEMTARSPFRRGRSAFDCSVIYKKYLFISLA
jgi:hypothetical protein